MESLLDEQVHFITVMVHARKIERRLRPVDAAFDGGHQVVSCP